ncbi:hypothetical protein EJ06DRAFT_526007 [Trichodelitschia bisporula]|uniref:Integral membrane protein n=1 Tax=Trichodelitschia bisporula TaxID=703511 RepID=A0A6G1IB08_9PEZI|nr:hypothetical protein EJ06DRAFT_526007 [Trichodelitschia bisporula]
MPPSSLASSPSLAQRHALQCLESPSRGLSALLHASGLAVFAYGYRHLLVTPNPINDSYGWHMQYLTIIGLSISTASFTCGLLADVTLSPRLFAWKNILSVASAPLEVLISLLYWGLRAIDPKLVVPEWAPPLDIIVDWCFHVAPAVALTADMLFFSPPSTVAALPVIALSSTIAFGYWFWIELCFSYNGFYPYPIFELLDPPSRIVLFATSALSMALSTWALQWLYSRVNGSLEAGRTKRE